MSIRTPVNLALLGDPEAEQYCEILDLSGLLGDLAVGCASGTAPTITTASLNAMTFGTAFSQTLAATGTTPITWTVSAGTLPGGLNLSAAGELTGTPTASGAYDFTVQATNGAGNDTQQYTGTVAFLPLELFQSAEKGGWYDPSNLSTLWQNSTMTTPVTATGQPVGLIEDQSGNNNHAYITTDSKRPLLQVDGDGKYYLAFDGIDDGLITDENIAWGSQSTWAQGFKKALGYALERLLGAVNQAAFGLRRATTAYSLYFGGYSSGTTALNINVADDANKHVLIGDRNGVANTGHLYLDGSTLLTDTHNQTALSAQLSISSRGSDAANPYASYFYGGVYITRTLTAGERASLTEYLADKTGVTLP